MVKFLLFMFCALAANLLIPTQAQLISLHDQIDEFSSTIIQLDGDLIRFFDRDSLYSFEPVPLGNYDDLSHTESEGARRKWIVRRVTNALNNVKADSRTSRKTLRFLRDGEINKDPHENGNATKDEDNSQYFSRIVNAVLSLLCVVTAALAAGLTMGLLSLDPLTLEIKRRASPSQEERKWSEDLLPLLVGHSKRHRLLVSLLLMNSIANEALPLFLDELLPGKYASILVSVTLVLFFGEIVPSAFFTGPDQVKVAAKLVPMVKVVMALLSPLAIPIASLLDKVLHEDGGHGGGSNVDSGAVASNGEEMEEEDVTGGNYYNRGELSALVRIQYEAQVAAKRKNKMANQSLMLAKAGTLSTHSKEFPEVTSQLSNVSMNSSPSNGKNSRHTHREIRSIGRDLTQNASLRGDDKRPLQIIPYIHADEITMIEGALAMTTKVAADICTPLRRVFALPSDTVLDEDCMVKIWSRGFSRIPVYRPSTDTQESVASSTIDAPRTGLFHEVETSSIIGVLLTRQLIVLNPEERRPITTIPLVPPPCIAPSVHLVDLINLFQAGGGRGKGGLHLAVVCARPKLATEALERGDPVPNEAGVVGIVTLEDVVEELLQEEIYDEYDRDLELSRWGINKWKRFVKKKKVGRNVAESGAHLDSTLVRKVVIASEINTEVTPLLG
ncbi:hypothetical protein HJC23_002712 [Cyclotella cryptica]|uniref:CNNM transmembrane domain-containing protein n=1 Tax=Cyclotella cryptica TaxID=29204 RepID=A0ABD3PBX5_9STRA|eukprot:CCRYP_016062-RA/>CCRYP_016062-RA protein AED:0.35 eAED:0.35 QI:0/-1/0/1/-1/1/1/0/670